MARRGRKRSGRRGGARRRTGSGNTFNFVVPYVQSVAEGNSFELTFNNIFASTSSKAMFSLVPWRLSHVVIQMSATSFMLSDSKESFSGEPAYVQVALDSGQMVNIENFVSRRYLVNQMPITRTLRMRSPNPWKEDEQRGQSLLSVSNLHSQGSVKNSTAYFLMHFHFQFGSIPFTPSSKLWRASPQTSSPGRCSTSMSPYSDFAEESPGVPLNR